MRSQDEIVARINERKDGDFLGFETSEYINALDYEHAKPFLNDGVTSETWDRRDGALLSDDAVVKEMREYVDFAYEKINGERGISANRTVMHYIAWLWLIGADELLSWVDSEYESNYHGYGRHIVDRIVKDMKLREGAEHVS